MRFLLFLALLPVVALADEWPLFASDEPLDITIEFPLRDLMRKAADRPVVDGVASYRNASGEITSLPVKMSTRGRSRLAVCRFPPIALSVKKKAAAGTVFEGQKTLKIVTHCRGHKLYRNYLLQEFAIYRAFNVLTEASFRPRLLNITYRDSEDKEYEITEQAFFIESIGEVAARNELKRKKVPGTQVSQLDPFYATLSAMFHFMIGNTDWSVKKAPAGSNCCHNGRVLGPKGEDAGWKVVPYDFDQAGLVDAEYAEPAEQLRLRSVKQRLWRGRCVHNDELDDVIAVFNDRREAIEAALHVPDERELKTAMKYIDSFYRTINDPKKRQRSIERRCLASN
jgi:hypothetical protein